MTYSLFFRLGPLWALLLLWTTVFAGPAPVPSSKDETSREVSYREETAFTLFRGSGSLSLSARSSAASNNLSTAIESDEGNDEKVAEIVREASSSIVKVRGYTVLVIDIEDAKLAGYSDLDSYSSYLQEHLEQFVPKQRFRLQIQRGFLRFFVSVFVLLIVFLLIRGLHSTFQRTDEWVEERRGSFKAVSFMSETIVSGETLAGLVVFALSLTKIFTYFLTIILGFGFILGQFSSTRALLQTSAVKLASLMIVAVESMVSLVPGLLLAGVLVFALQTGLRILNLFLRGVSSGRISRKFITPLRVPVFRFFGSAVLVLCFLPLILASTFGRYETPFENFVLLFGLGLTLGATPVLASICYGGVVIWKQILHPGDWVQLGELSGEIAVINLFEVRIVPVGGGEIVVPMLAFMIYPMKRSRKAPDQNIDIELVKEQSAGKLLEVVQGLFGDELEVEVQLRSISQTHVGMRLISRSPAANIRQSILLRVCEASEDGMIQLYEGATS